MTNDEFLDGDEKLANFMGHKITRMSFKDWNFLAHCDEDGSVDYCEMEYWSPHNNWNELMSVLDKIEKIDETYDQFGTLLEICTTHIRVGHFMLDLKANPMSRMTGTWKTVVAYVTWYEAQPTFNLAPGDKKYKYMEPIYIQ